MWREWRRTGSRRWSMWECAGSRSVGRPRKRLIDTMTKSGLDVRESRRMVQAMNVWRGFVRGNAWGIAPAPTHTHIYIYKQFFEKIKVMENSVKSIGNNFL